MSMFHTVTGLGGLAVATHLAIQAILPNAGFMRVEAMQYDGGMVNFERVVFAPATVADWTASVFAPGADQPVCSGHGWDEYTPEEEQAQPMPLDVFVNDEGCESRLNAGNEYRLYVFWVPRDGRDAVAASTVFVR